MNKNDWWSRFIRVWFEIGYLRKQERYRVGGR